MGGLRLWSADEATTRAIGAAVAGLLHPGDAYRLSGPLELEDLGLGDVLSADAVVFVEWADRVAAALPESWLELVLHIADDDHREIEVTPHGDAWAARGKPLAAALDPFTR